MPSPRLCLEDCVAVLVRADCVATSYSVDVDFLTLFRFFADGRPDASLAMRAAERPASAGPGVSYTCCFLLVYGNPVSVHVDMFKKLARQVRLRDFVLVSLSDDNLEPVQAAEDAFLAEYPGAAFRGNWDDAWAALRAHFFAHSAAGQAGVSRDAFFRSLASPGGLPLT